MKHLSSFPSIYFQLVFYLFVYSLALICSSSAEKVTFDSMPSPIGVYGDGLQRYPNITSFFKIKPSIADWNTIDSKSPVNAISILSMKVDHHSDTSWYLAHLHGKHSLGWNRTTEQGFLNRPYACSLRFVGKSVIFMNEHD
jgi:hypothetical protein